MRNAFFESEDTEVSKADRNALFASNKKQIDIHTLMLDMLHSNNCQLYVPINVEVYLKRFFFGVDVVFFFIVVAIKATKDTELRFYVHKAPSKVDEWKTIE